ncbi:MAG: 50S ribosomal protein L21 [Patescibacteria group bacterium]|nr:50S ribosomal protein L21 [Patescibacteria group bacterium]MDE2116858.1 50S ribosomal protein L21 [Patescibacteria group bacterium]
MATNTATKKTTKTAPKAAAKPVSKPEKAAPAVKGDALAVIATGGKQYKVRVGDVVKIEKILGDHKVGDKLVFGNVLLLDSAGSTVVGAPYISGSKVEAEIKEIGRDPKIVVVHYKQKSKYFKKYGHRQPFFKVAITSIA